LKKNILVAQNMYGYITWHGAVCNGCLQALEALWVWTKEVE